MPRNGSVKERRLSRSEQAWKMRAEGKSLRTIGSNLGISHEEVRRLLKETYAKRSAELENNVASYKLEQIDQLDTVIEEAMAAWIQSKLNAEEDKKVTKQQGAKSDPQPVDGLAREDRDPEDVPGGLYLDPETGEEIEPEERARRLREAGRAEALLAQSLAASGLMLTVEEITTKVSKGQTGNPSHLMVMLNALKAKRDILGLDAPKDAGGGVSVVVKMYAQETNVEEMV